MYQVLSKILFNIEVSPTYYKMGIDCPEIASIAVPGQFIMIRVSNQLDPLLRRPFVIHRIQRANTGSYSQVEILYKIVGKGTEIMSKMKEYNDIDLLGPVGNGYRIDSNIRTAVLVGGGIGVAPLLSLAERIISQCSRLKSLILLLGGKGRDDVLCVEEFERLGVEVRVATEDGSLEHRGLVVDLLLDYLESRDYSPGSSTHCFACGPDTMLKEVSKIIAEKGISCQISLESRMACAVGACLGCVVRTKAGGDVYKKVCKDGPVFDSNEIIWE
ncbi:MAG: dihydroorotate dehydrogenase electron transfer subunit [bacterium]|nr:MAG: dihydroorotate dehydrogenase electron transfer subunit [bacterium]